MTPEVVTPSRQECVGRWVNLTTECTDRQAVVEELGVDRDSKLDELESYEVHFRNDDATYDLLWTADKHYLIPRSMWRPKSRLVREENK